MIPVLAISAWSGTGKTTLLKKINPRIVCCWPASGFDQAYPS